MAQVCKRLDELSEYNQPKKVTSRMTNTKKDSCFLTEDSVVLLQKFVDEDHYECLCYRKQFLDNYFTVFVSLKDIGIYFISNTINPILCIKRRSSFLRKCIFMAVKGGFVVSALVHFVKQSREC